MPDFFQLEPAEKISFQIAWESTLKCNLNCSYCGDGHDNTKPHPSLENSLRTVDFIFEYTDYYMKRRPDHWKIANLNVQGGESLFHPGIVDIFKYINEKTKQYSWYMGVATITNAVVGKRHWEELSKYINYYTVSYHAESTKKQQDLVRDNILFLKDRSKNFHVSVMMHPGYWDNCVTMVEWCKQNGIKHNARQLDHDEEDTQFNYTMEQAEYLFGPQKVKEVVKEAVETVDLAATGRACCGGTAMCTNKTANTNYVIGNNFEGWNCSVNEFFLYIRQVTGEVFTNKDCRMNFDGKRAPIGYLNNTQEILDRIKNGIEPIVCKNKKCYCGLCAPKAQTRELYDSIMKKYTV